MWRTQAKHLGRPPTTVVSLQRTNWLPNAWGWKERRMSKCISRTRSADGRKDVSKTRTNSSEDISRKGLTSILSVTWKSNRYKTNSTTDREKNWILRHLYFVFQNILTNFAHKIAFAGDYTKINLSSIWIGKNWCFGLNYFLEWIISAAWWAAARFPNRSLIWW